MSDHATLVPTRASGKKSSASKAVNPPAPEPTSDTRAQLNPAPNADEKLVAETAAAQLKAVYEQHWRDMSTSGCQLIHFAEERLEGVGLGNLSAEQGDAFYLAAALVEGCIAIERTKEPNQGAIEQLESVLATLDSAAISYGFDQEGCEALSTGIRAGVKRHRDPPQPPIRRVNDQLDSALRYACSLGELLFDEVAEPRSLIEDVNDCRSATQRQFALLDSLQAKLAEMQMLLGKGVQA